MGFDAIWISSPLDNLEGHEMADGYHGYWHRNWEQISSRFGSEEDLHQLVTTYHDRGIYVMVDVVPNHVAPVDFDYSQIVPFNNEEHFHPFCHMDHGDQWSKENCRLCGATDRDCLPDLNQENSYVKDYLKYNYVRDLV